MKPDPSARVSIVGPPEQIILSDQSVAREQGGEDDDEHAGDTEWHRKAHFRKIQQKSRRSGAPSNVALNALAQLAHAYTPLRSRERV
jgi:hypothetical protein